MLRQAGGHDRNDAVTERVPERVIHRLEAIKVEDEHRGHTTLSSRRARQSALTSL